MKMIYPFVAGILVGVPIGLYLLRRDEKLNFIIHKLTNMKEDLKEIKKQLVDADTKADKIAADVKLLHDKIDGIGDNPTPEEWQEVKDMASKLNSKLQGIDDATPE